MKRSAGILMHISSLPGKRGIGSLGNAAYEFVDFAADAKLSLWQVLPLCTTSYGDSPYQSPSALAGNPYFIDLDTLAGDGLLRSTELPEYPAGDVDYARLFEERYATLKKAYRRFDKNLPDYVSFKAENASWLDDYALFMAIKEAHGYASWDTWEDGLRYRTASLKKFSARAEFYKFLQYEFFTQWKRLKAYANSKGIYIVGDMPIYVAYDSVDVWADPKQFLLEPDLSRKSVAGVPPDYFSAEGQLWGNPIYDWDYMESTGYAWWIKRMRAALGLYDIIRIDHFRAFADYYAIPAGYTDAKIGEWKTGPDKKFFDVIDRELGSPAIIAEDLGELHDCVRELVKATGYPGMKVLQFAFDGNPANEFFYENYPENCVAYSGTHDNDTTRGWFSSLDDGGKELVCRMLDCSGERVTQTFVERLFASKANTVVIPMQDFLDLPSSARMNTPSTLGGNWTWRCTEDYGSRAAEIRALVESTGRA